MSAIYSVDSPVNGALPKVDLPAASPPTSGNTDAAAGLTTGATDALTIMLDASTATNTPNTGPKPTVASATNSTPPKTAGTDLAAVVNGKTTPPPSKAEVAMDALVRHYAGLVPADQDTIEGTLSLPEMQARAAHWNRSSGGKDAAARELSVLLDQAVAAKDPNAFLDQNPKLIAHLGETIGAALARRRGFEARVPDSGPTPENVGDPKALPTATDEAVHRLNNLFRMTHGGDFSRPDTPLARLAVVDKNMQIYGTTYADRQLSDLIGDFQAASAAGKADQFLAKHGARFDQVESAIVAEKNAPYRGGTTTTNSSSSYGSVASNNTVSSPPGHTDEADHDVAAAPLKEPKDTGPEVAGETGKAFRIWEFLQLLSRFRA